jgi:hypothetical protein
MVRERPTLVARFLFAVCACLVLMPRTTSDAQEAAHEPAKNPSSAPIQQSRQTSGAASSSDQNASGRQTRQSICLLIDSAARANGLPVEFFVRLIWQESRFRPGAVGPSTRNGKHALGIAQFMPSTAAERDLLDPFNPVEALPKAAQFLKDLRGRFGNLGLAAAAYNAGPARVRTWINGTGPIPAETRSYVLAVTGNSIDDWAAGRDAKHDDAEVTCATLMAKVRQPPSTFLTALQNHVEAGAVQPWGAILGADRSRVKMLARYALLQKRFANALAGKEPILFERGSSALPRYQIRAGAASRGAADNICRQIHVAGGDCVVLRNPAS